MAFETILTQIGTERFTASGPGQQDWWPVAVSAVEATTSTSYPCCYPPRPAAGEHMEHRGQQGRVASIRQLFIATTSLLATHPTKET